MVTHLVVDTNILDYSMKSVDNFNRLADLVAATVPGKHEFVVTPFSMLEMLGIRPDRPVRIRVKESDANRLRKGIKSGKWSDSLDHIRRRYLREFEQHYRELPELKKKALFRKMGERLQYVSPELHSRYLETFGRFKKRDIGLLCNRLALEHLYRLQYPADLQSFVHSQYMVDTPKSIEEGISLTQMGGLNSMWFGFQEFILSKARGGEIPCTSLERVDTILKTISPKIKLKTKEDRFDSELVHLLSIGKVDGATLRPVVALVGADYESILYRVSLYRSVMSNTWEIYEKAVGAAPKTAPGRCVVVSRALEVEHEFVVADVPDLMQHLDHSVRTP